MSDVPCDMLNRFVFVYIDDILFSETREENSQHVCLVLQHLFENKLCVKADKCNFYSPYVSCHLGHLAKVRAVAEWPFSFLPQTAPKFLGIVHSFVTIASWWHLSPVFLQQRQTACSCCGIAGVETLSGGVNPTVLGVARP